jgi:hypothetical protein
MIRYLTHSQIDKKKWDDCIRDAFNGIIYAYSWYLDIVSENWEALVDNDYERVFPMTKQKKWEINFLYQPLFAKQLGIISRNILTEDIVHLFLDAIPGKFRFGRINLNSLNKATKKNFRINYLETFELDMIKPYGNLQREYSPDLKQIINDEVNSGLTVLKSIKPDPIIELFLANRNKRKKSQLVTGLNNLKRLSYLGIYKGMISTYGVYSNRNDFLAGAILARSNKKMILLFSSQSNEGKDMKALALLIDYILKEHAMQHLTLSFDNTFEQLPEGFYQKFGALQSVYPSVSFNRLPLFQSLFYRLFYKI